MSYAATTTLIPDSTTDASFRAWGSAISASLTSMGLSMTSDTGQINWATVLHPTTTSQTMGYEIWKFNDSLQGTVPVIIKLEYGSASGAAVRPGLWITVSSASNGSGTLTGQVTGRFQLGGTTTNTALFSCVFSGDTNRIGMALFTNLSGGAFAWFLERTKNSDGTDSSLGALLATYDGIGSNRRMQFIPASGAVPASITDSNIQPPINATSGSYGNDLGIYTNPFSRGGGYLNAGMTHVGYFTTDILTDITFAITMYNASHTFYALGNTPYLNSVGRATFLNIVLAMRFE